MLTTLTFDKERKIHKKIIPLHRQKEAITFCMKTLKYIIIFACAYTILSCSQANNQSNITECEVGDTANLQILPQIEVTELPDTIFASIRTIYYSITVFDSTKSGKLDTLTNAYQNCKGIFTFRGSPLRDANFYCKTDSVPTKISIAWTYSTDFDTTKTDFGIWGGGTGWTGQPLYVEWNNDQVAKIKSECDSLTSNFANKEVIIGSLSGNVHFINYETGKASRKPLSGGNNIKGTPMLDPRGNGNLYVGQGIPRETPIGAVVIDLFSHKINDFFPNDSNAWRSWGAYDASPIIAGNFLFRVGENGTIYKYSLEGKNIKLHSTLRYKANGNNAAGIEASMSVYRNYGYTADNHGNILCINLNNLQPVWYYNNHDDSDASIVIELENGKPYLYTGCEIDKQGNDGLCYIVKLDAVTGEKIWEQTINCKKMNLGGKHFDGGMYSTPLLGRGNCSNLIFTNICLNDPAGYGSFYAFDKQTGEIAYSTALRHYAWSSPIAIMNSKDEMYIFTGDTKGNAYIIEGFTGKILACEPIGINFESSPIAVDNHIIIGSRGTNIYKLKIE